MNPSREVLFAIALNQIPFVGAVTFRRLVEEFGSAEKVFQASRARLRAIKYMREEAVQAISSCDAEKEGLKEWEKAFKLGFKILYFGGEGYPENLKNIHDPPPVLYVAGEIRESDSSAVAVVGSRDPTEYGKKVTAQICEDLVSAGVTIVSGMARGIDSEAHRSAIANGGRTIAVLGCGLDIVYPPENVRLFKAIAENGAVLSPFPLGTRPEKGNFPARNRIISGLSLGVVVIQATTPDSGSLITARHALEQGREVFAVPGEIGKNTSRGTNILIKKGEAKLVENASDILVEIFPQLAVSQANGGKTIPAEKPHPKLEGDEKRVYETIGDEPVHIDIIARKCNIPVHELSAVLLKLELKELVLRQAGMNYVRK